MLITPHAKKIEVDDNTLIVEETLDFDSNESAQKELYHKYSTALNETTHQLALFIAKTGYNDVAWRNIPILNEAPEFRGDRRVGLIDLEHLYSINNGFTGGSNRSCGLIKCVSAQQIDIVIDEARKQGVTVSQDFSVAKEERLQEIDSDKKLRQFYETKRIVTGKEPLQVDLESLELDLNEKGEITLPGYNASTVSMRKVSEDVITEINRKI